MNFRPKPVVAWRPPSWRAHTVRLPLSWLVLIGMGGLAAIEPSGIQPGEGGGGNPVIPASSRKRFTKSDRLIRIQESGGVPEIEEAVTKGLQYLNRTQQPDGTWPGGPGMTALAVLAYLGQGEAMLSKEFGEPCWKGIVALIDLAAKNNGLFSNESRDRTHGDEHGLVTYALAETAVWAKTVAVDLPNLNDTVRRAGQFIIDHQHESGGWNPGFTKSGGAAPDLRVTAWQVMALRTCSLTKLEFRDLAPCTGRALGFIESLQHESGAFVLRAGAPPHGKNVTLTGAGILCFQICQKGPLSVPRHAAKRATETTRFDYNGESADLYGHFFASQAMINFGGERWKHYRALTLKPLLDHQNPDGSWKIPGGGRNVSTLSPEANANAHHRTCLCVLMLEVYYHHLTTIPRIRPEGDGGKEAT